MPNVILNGSNKKIILNGKTYLGTGTTGTKTITENGTYNASNDNLDGYSQVTVNVPFPIITPLEFWYRDTDSGEEGDTPEHNLVLDKQAYYSNHSNTPVGYPDSYTYWNPETKYIEIKRDFDALLQYTLHGYSDSVNYAEGALYINDEQVAFLQALYKRYTSVYIPVSLKTGDTIAIRKPEDKGWSYHELFINYLGEL